MNQLFMLCLVMVCTHTSKAQVQNMYRTELFSNTFQSVMVKERELDKTFFASTLTLIRLQFKKFDLEGTLTSSDKCDDNLQSLVIKLSALDNSLFSNSKRINEEKTISYTGRIIYNKYTGGHELIKEEDGGYVLNKIKTGVIFQNY